MKIRTKTKERLLSEGWYYYENGLRKEGVEPIINEIMQEILLGKVLDKEQQVLEILREYESRRQGNSNRG